MGSTRAAFDIVDYAVRVRITRYSANAIQALGSRLVFRHEAPVRRSAADVDEHEFYLYIGLWPVLSLS